jgi:proteasome lid subunit RPN8/RPN11
VSPASRQRTPEVAGLEGVCERDVYPHVFENSGREVGGFLIGRASVTGQLPVLSGAIEARHAAENRADLTFTQDTWEHAHRELRRRGDVGERIVGWYHSHPGFGVFLSENDAFVHQSFFSDPSQVALVIDPIRRQEGLFVWDQDELTRSFDRATPVKWAATEEPADRRVARQRARRASPILVHLAALLVGVLLGLGLYFATLTADRPVAPSTTPAAGGNRSSAKPEPSPSSTQRQKSPKPAQLQSEAVQAEQVEEEAAPDVPSPATGQPNMHSTSPPQPAGSNEIDGPLK